MKVGAGTFTEQITLTYSLTLVGAGAGATKIVAPASLVANDLGAKDIVGVRGAATSVRMSNLTVSGPSQGLTYGIFVFGGATLDIADATI